MTDATTGSQAQTARLATATAILANQAS